MVRSLPFTAAHAHPAVIVPVQARTADELVDLVARAHTSSGIDALEWRVDALDAMRDLDGVETPVDGQPGGPWLAALDEIRGCCRELTRFTIPVLATVRSGAEGGPVRLAESVYTRLVRELIATAPAAVDVEFGRRDARELYAMAGEAGVATVASFHDFAKTPESPMLADLLIGMERAGASVAKFAVQPTSVSDVLRILEIGAKATGVFGTDGSSSAHGWVDIPVMTIAMGRLGQLTRIAGEFGSAATFATLDEGSAPGQLSVADTLEVFRARGLSE